MELVLGQFFSLWDILLCSRQVLLVFPVSRIFHYSSDIQISHCFLLCSRLGKKYGPDSNFI